MVAINIILLSRIRVERLCFEVNDRVNYPLKETLVKIMDISEVNVDNKLHKYCVTWFTISMYNTGIKLFVNSWDTHPLLGI